MALLYDQRDLAPLSQQELDEAVRKHNMFISARVGGARANLTYRNLSNLLMRGAKLTGADFSGSLLFNCDVRGANLDNSVFFTASMQKSDFANASVVRGDFRGCNFKGANFSGADMTSADLREGSIATKDKRGNINLMLQAGSASESKKPSMGYFTEFVDATEAIFTGAKMVRVMMRGANFTNAVLEKVDFSGAQMQGASLRGAVLRGARFDGVDLAEVDRNECLTDDLQGLALADEATPLEILLQEHSRWLTTHGAAGRRLDFSRFDLRPDGEEPCDLASRNLVMMKAVHAILYHMRFANAQMQASELRDNDLRMARFDKADLRGVDFSGSNMMRACLQLAQLGPLKLPNGQFMKSDLSRCNLRYADFTGADLRGVNFTGADLTAADLRGADIEGAILDRAVTEGAMMGG
jgi:uncharacterized protein YjbI with pentapeptide repeats